MEKKYFEQAKLWLQGAKHIGYHFPESNDKYSVAVAMTIHSIIRANDALSFKSLKLTPKRHDEAIKIFEDLIKKNIVKAEYSNYKEIIQRAVWNKSKAEYGDEFFGKRDFEDMLRKAEKFLRMVEVNL